DLTRDIGSSLVGGEAVKHGLINEVGGIDKALKKLNELIGQRPEKQSQVVQ
ncbi:MAG TPA: translocation-enhancing protein TepA, partial [Sporolactobacillaceae bacterium]|nr:translocation-enhancing protein TepA [Sporolactobacillaceae bacterium]